MKVGEFARRAVRPGCPRRLSSKLHLKERAAISFARCGACTVAVAHHGFCGET